MRHLLLVQARVRLWMRCNGMQTLEITALPHLEKTLYVLLTNWERLDLKLIITR